MRFNRFTKEYEIHYYQIDKTQKATALSLVNLLEDTAISHSQSIGLGIDELKSKGIVWLINCWNIIIDKYPKCHDRISIENWTSHFERFYATKEFYIKDIDGEIIARASTLWILMSIEKKRPIRIPLEFGEMYGINPEKAIDDPFSPIEYIDGYEAERKFDVRRRDIDTNEHVNNSRYMEWALEQVPADVYDNHCLHSIEIKYKKETTLGNVIISRCNSFKKENGMSICLHSILSDDGNTEVASAKTVWIKK